MTADERPGAGLQGVRCPRCAATLSGREYSEPQAEFTVYACGNCGGQLLSDAQLRSVEETVLPKLLELRHLPSPSEQQASISCPACPGGARMEKFRHHRDAQVVLDRCPQCRSIWLDAGELEAIQEESLPVFFANTVRYFWGMLRT